MRYSDTLKCNKNLIELKVKEPGYHDIESKISYHLNCGMPKIPVSQLFPQGITIINSAFALIINNIIGSVQINNIDHPIFEGIISIIVIGNFNFGIFNLQDTSNNVIVGTFSNTTISGDYFVYFNLITIKGGLINGCVINSSNSQMTNSIGFIDSLTFRVATITIEPSTLITLTYNGQIVLPYKPQIGLFKNDKLIFKTELPSLKINNIQLIYIILSQFSDLANLVYTGLSSKLQNLILMFPPPFLPEIPDFYIILDNSEVILGTKDKLNRSDILSVKLLDNCNPFKINLICKGSNIELK